MASRAADFTGFAWPTGCPTASPAPGTSRRGCSGLRPPGSERGCFIGPLISGIEPRGQKLGVNVLFLALFAVVGGSLTGEWLSVQNKLSDAAAFLLGPPGVRVHRSRPRVATASFSGAAVLVLPGGASGTARTEDQPGASLVSLAVPGIGRGPSACSTAPA